MITVLALLAVSCLGFAVASAFLYGLWLGERGRRIAAENWKVTGTPEAGPAKTLTPTDLDEKAAREAAEATGEDLNRAFEWLKGIAEKDGLTASDDELWEEAKRLVLGSGQTLADGARGNV